MEVGHGKNYYVECDYLELKASPLCVVVKRVENMRISETRESQRPPAASLSPFSAWRKTWGRYPPKTALKKERYFANSIKSEIQFRTKNISNSLVSTVTSKNGNSLPAASISKSHPRQKIHSIWGVVDVRQLVAKMSILMWSSQTCPVAPWPRSSSSCRPCYRISQPM